MTLAVVVAISKKYGCCGCFGWFQLLVIVTVFVKVSVQKKKIQKQKQKQSTIAKMNCKLLRV